MEIKEEWRTIEEYPDYMISNLGNVKSLKFGKERIMKQAILNGYCRVNLSKDEKKKNYLVHRLVATAFLPNPQNLPQVNHKNEQKTDNRIDNLEWCTQEYNINHGMHNERMGKAHQKPILQFNKQGTKIIGKWDSAVQASKKLNINRSHICDCCNGTRKTCGGYKFMYLQDYINRMEKLYQMIIKKAS